MEVIKGYGAPTAETIGDLNDLYVDLDTGDVYRCTNVTTIGEKWGDVTLYACTLDNTVYTWAAAGVVSDATTVTAESITEALGYTPADDAEVTQLKSDLNELKDDVAQYGLPVLKVTGDISTMTNDNEVTLDYVYGILNGSCTMKWQGSSSIRYPKKNFTIKFDNAFEAYVGWGKQEKYCLKANYIDFSHARNLVSAKLWGQVVASRPSRGVRTLTVDDFELGFITSSGAERDDESYHNRMRTSEYLPCTLSEPWGIVNDGNHKWRAHFYDTDKNHISYKDWRTSSYPDDGGGGILYEETDDVKSKCAYVRFVLGDWDGSIGTSITDKATWVSYFEITNKHIGVNPMLESLSQAPNYGAVDGFPICLFINDEYHGIYTFNIPKDGWMFGMGSGTSEAVVCAEQPTDTSVVKFRKADVTLGTDYDVEYAPDENNVTWIKTSLDTMISACINSDGTDLDTIVAQYLDWDSVIDYLIFTVLQHGFDGLFKNYLLATYDGVKWFFSAYDMDSTYGLYWDGSYFCKLKEPYSNRASIGEFCRLNRAMELVKTYKADALKARYAELRADILSEDNVVTAFANFMGGIPKALYDKECTVWKGIPSTATNNLYQITDFYRRKCKVIDAEIEAL